MSGQFPEDRLKSIYDKTTGYCHICGKKLAFSNYGSIGSRCAWEVEHSIPRAKGGTDHLNNLFAACITCNRKKGAKSTATARRQNGKTRDPLNVAARKIAKQKQALIGGIAGTALGGLICGPPGAVFGALAGAHAGKKKTPDNR
jgi:5-methylcytosine-specific restriction endonuclease McrA